MDAGPSRGSSTSTPCRPRAAADLRDTSPATLSEALHSLEIIDEEEAECNTEAAAICEFDDCFPSSEPDHS